MMAKRCSFAVLTLVLASACRGEAQKKFQYETIDVKLKDKPFTLEIADTDEKRMQGLMYRKSMPADRGMLFVFQRSGRYEFWMKNTEIPLDAIFLDDTGKVVGIFALKPRDEKSVGPDKASKFVIEINAGKAQEAGLKVGDMVTLPEKVLKG
jgi:uncharacterized membrane protein (UPF0127 family)